MATVLTQNGASACVPASLMVATVKAAALVAAGQAAAGALAVPVVALAEGVIRAMFLARLKTIAVVVLVVGLLGSGVGVVSYRTLAAAADGPGTTALSREEKLKQEMAELKKELHRMEAKMAVLEAKLANKGDDEVYYQGKPASFWLKQLKDTDPSFRQNAAKALGYIGLKDQTLIPVLVECLKDADSEVRCQAIDSFGGPALKDKTVLTALMKSLKDSDPNVRWRAMSSLLYFDPPAKTARPAIIEAWKSYYAYFIRDACHDPEVWERLLRMDPEGTAFVPLFIQGLKDPQSRMSTMPVLVLLVRKRKRRSLNLPTSQKAVILRSVSRQDMSSWPSANKSRRPSNNFFQDTLRQRRKE